MNNDLIKLMQNVSKVKLPGGVFGKTCTVLMVVSISMAVIAFQAGNVWISSATLTMIFILTFEAFYFFLVQGKFTQKLIKPDTFSRHIQKNHRIAHDDGGYIYNKYYKFN